MRRALRFLAVSVPILISLAINIVLAAPGKRPPILKRGFLFASTYNSSPCPLWVKSRHPPLAAVSLESDRMFWSGASRFLRCASRPITSAPVAKRGSE